MDLEFKNKNVINVTREYFETEDGRFYFFGGMGHDKAELLRRNLEKDTLIETKEKYQTLFESIEEAYFEVDLRGNFTFFNDSLPKILGYSQDELIGMNNRGYMSPESSKEIFVLFEQIYKTGKTLRKYGYEVIKKDGTHGFHELFASLMRDKSGKPIGFCGIAHDITERKQAEDMLQKNEEKYRMILENIEEGYFEVDIAGNFTFFNDSLCRMLNYSRDEMIGMNNQQYTDKENAQKLYQSFNQVYRTGEPAKGFECEIIKKDGIKRYIEASVSLMKNDSGQPVGFRGVVVDITNRKLEFQNLLNKKEIRFQNFAETLPFTLYEMDQHGKLTYVNQHAFSMFKYTEEQFKQGLNGFDLVVPEERGLLMKNLADVIAGKSVVPTEYTMIKGDGSRCNVLIHSSPIVNDAKLEGFQGFIIDISERKRIEEALRGSEEKFRVLLEKSPDPIFSILPQGQYLYANQAFATGVCRTVEEVIGKNFWDVFPKDEADKRFEFIGKVFSTGEEKVIEVCVPNTNDNQYYITTITPIKNMIGKTEYAICSSKNITERKRIEEALRESEEKYRIVIEKASDAIVVLQDGIIRFSNPSFANMLGYKTKEAEGMALSDFIPQENLAVVLERYRKRMAGDQLPQVFETVLLRQNKEKIKVETSGNLVHFQGKAADVVIMRDITERKRIEKILLESERLSAIGEMSSGVAHDFNNSLQTIFGNLELALLIPEISEEAERFIKSAKKGAQNAAARIRQLQRFTQKQQKGEYEAIDVNSLLEETVLQLQPIWKDSAQKNGIKISFQRSFSSCANSIDGDVGELGSVFHNVIKNAIEAMPDGGEVTLKTCVNDSEICVRIIDTGVGMDESTVKRVFQPFFSTKGFEAGRGLGMSAVFAIVRDHGGKISVKSSEVGKGTTIEMLFPVGTKKKESEKKEALGTFPTSARVLWVDDEPELRKIGKMFIEKLGHFADIAGSGQEAIELLKNNRYDLLITDVGMPGMSGWQMAEKIKGKYHPMKVAVVSGWGASISSQEKTKYEVGYVLGKPIGIEEIKNLVGEVLQLKV